MTEDERMMEIIENWIRILDKERAQARGEKYTGPEPTRGVFWDTHQSERAIRFLLRRVRELESKPKKERFTLSMAPLEVVDLPMGPDSLGGGSGGRHIVMQPRIPEHCDPGRTLLLGRYLIQFHQEVSELHILALDRVRAHFPDGTSELIELA